MAKSLTQMAADIVAAQASHSVMSADEMDATLKKVFEALATSKPLKKSPLKRLWMKSLRKCVPTQ